MTKSRDPRKRKPVDGDDGFFNLEPSDPAVVAEAVSKMMEMPGPTTTRAERMAARAAEGSSADAYVAKRTDKYFTKSRRIVDMFGEKQVKYAVFVRREIVVAVQPAIDLIEKFCPEAIVTRHYEDGTMLPSETKIFTVEGPMSKLVELETLFLQKVGFSCVSAYNAYLMAKSLPKVPFMDMAARHCTGDDMAIACAYGASVGSHMAKLQGAKGFIGSSTDLTSHFYGAEEGMGTTPHAIVGYAGSTLKSVQMYFEANPQDDTIVALVDFFGQEITDSLEVADWFFEDKLGAPVSISSRQMKLGVRLDTHGGRYAEGLDYAISVKLVCDWLHVDGEYEAVRKVMGARAYSMDTLDITKDKVRKLLFGTGVSAANIINTRQKLDAAGYSAVFIVVSSGFNLFKCEIMAEVGAPINMVGTGSFLPEKLSETYATADIFTYDGEDFIKIGREWLCK